VADSVPIQAVMGLLAPRAPGMYRWVDRDIVDRTGLVGLFNFTLDLDPSVSVFTLIQEQLGLKLEPTVAPSDFVVIDHVEQLIPD